MPFNFIEGVEHAIGGIDVDDILLKRCLDVRFGIEAFDPKGDFHALLLRHPRSDRPVIIAETFSLRSIYSPRDRRLGYGTRVRAVWRRASTYAPSVETP